MTEEKVPKRQNRNVSVVSIGEMKFPLDQVLASDKFTAIEKDFIRAGFDESKEYTINEATKILDKLKKGAVK